MRGDCTFFNPCDTTWPGRQAYPPGAFGNDDMNMLVYLAIAATLAILGVMVDMMLGAAE